MRKFVVFGVVTAALMVSGVASMSPQRIVPDRGHGLGPSLTALPPRAPAGGDGSGETLLSRPPLVPLGGDVSGGG